MAARVVHVIPDDLARVVDRKSLRFRGSQGIVQGGVCAAAQEVAMAAGDVVIVPDDLVRIIEADCLGGAGASGGIVEGVEGIDWHDTGSSVIVSLADSLDREAEAGSNSLARTFPADVVAAAKVYRQYRGPRWKP